MSLVVTESQAQKAIVEYLEIKGCTVLTTYIGMRHVVKDLPKQLRGILATPGVPDLLVTKPRWPIGGFLGLEVKRPQVEAGGKVLQRSGRPSAAQAELERAGRIYIVHSVDEAAMALESFEKALGVRL